MAIERPRDGRPAAAKPAAQRRTAAGDLVVSRGSRPVMWRRRARTVQCGSMSTPPAGGGFNAFLFAIGRGTWFRRRRGSPASASSRRSVWATTRWHRASTPCCRRFHRCPCLQNRSRTSVPCSTSTTIRYQGRSAFDLCSRPRRQSAQTIAPQRISHGRGIFRTQKFSPVGECIYCGARGSEVELTDEHIVPYSLGGNVQLLQASCKPCARITGALEGYVGRKVLWDFRVHAKIPTRRPSERPDVLPARISLAFRGELRPRRSGARQRRPGRPRDGDRTRRTIAMRPAQSGPQLLIPRAGHD